MISLYKLVCVRLTSFNRLGIKIFWTSLRLIRSLTAHSSRAIACSSFFKSVFLFVSHKKHAGQLISVSRSL